MIFSPTYVLDSSVFIQAKRQYYAFDLVPSFWDALVTKAQAGQVQSIDRVKAEINRGQDDLMKWANSNFLQWFFRTDQTDVYQSYRNVIKWANDQPQFSEAAKSEFACVDNADAWVIAYASARKYIVVTQEIFSPDIKRRILIPNVCKAFSVKFVDTFEMLRKLGVTL